MFCISKRMKEVYIEIIQIYMKTGELFASINAGNPTDFVKVKEFFYSAKEKGDDFPKNCMHCHTSKVQI